MTPPPAWPTSYAEEAADVLTSYDPDGGYGHPDHVQVHGLSAPGAGHYTGTRVDTLDHVNHNLVRMGLEVATSLGHELPPDFAPESFDTWYTPADELTHAGGGRGPLGTKRRAMEPHGPAAAADVSATRSLAVFVTLPEEYFELAFGTEWFVDHSQPAGAGLDVSAT